MRLNQVTLPAIDVAASVAFYQCMSRLSRARQALQREAFGDDHHSLVPKNGKQIGPAACSPAPVNSFETSA